jgi:dihydrofolate reductase
MGRKTFESIGRPLPNRRNIIISRQKNEIDGCEIVSSIEEALTKDSDIYILGGGEIYEKTIHLADKILLTLIHSEFEGDTFFPEIDSSWKKISEEHFKSDSMNEYDYSFIEYSKI